MRRLTTQAFFAVALASYGIAPGDAQTLLLSDSFERTAGSLGDPGEIPPDPGFSDWGSFDNGLGGTVTPRPYLTTNANNSNQQTVGLPEDSAAGYGAIRFGRTILNYNLATDPFVQAGGGFVVQYKINPTDVGGRDWAGVGLIDTNSLVRIGGQGAVAAAGNDNMRLALMPRNSGSLLIRRNNSTDVDVPSTAAGNAPNDDDASEYRRLIGNPLGAFNEPVFDPVALAEYTALMAGDPASTVAYPSDVFYSVRLEITSPDFTVRNGPAFARIFINNQEVDLDDAVAGVQGGPFRLGNEPALMGTDTNELPYQGGLYLAFIGNTATQLFDDLIVSAMASVPTDNADFNGDEIVDGADFLIWQRGLGLTGQTNNANGDANGNGTVNGDDLAIWAAAYGGPPAMAAGASVPEPHAAALAMVAAALSARRRRRRRDA